MCALRVAVQFYLFIGFIFTFDRLQINVQAKCFFFSTSVTENDVYTHPKSLNLEFSKLSLVDTPFHVTICIFNSENQPINRH